MSSSIDAGHAAEVARKIKQSDCIRGGEHDWERLGSYPSTWGKCRKCGATYFDK